MEPCVPLPLINGRLDHLVREAKDFAISNGFVLRTVESPSSSDKVIHGPMALLPTPIPRSCFEHAKRIQKDFNLLMHRVAHDHEFLKSSLKSTVKVDEFTGRLWEIYETVRSEGIAQHLSLALNRNDFMLDCSPDEVFSIKQIEFNTMAASFGGLAEKVVQLHRFMLSEIGECNKLSNIPDNNVTIGFAKAISCAWKLYGQPQAVFLHLVYETERNIYDQRHLEQAIKRINPKIRVVRKSLAQIQKEGSLDSNKKLIVDGCEVAIVYQRSCYSPDDFKTDQDWATRLLIERSCAIKCPNVHYHLAGTKKVQQVLAQPGVIERYLDNSESVNEIRQTFVALLSLDMGSEGDAAVEMALKEPQKYVLKPQREGGGNNTYGEDIPKVLLPIKDSSERTAYILMERVNPLPTNNYAVRSGQPTNEPIALISELGIYGSLVGTANEVLHNEEDGHVLRSKSVDTDEGGVATGYAVIDSPFLC